MAILRPFKADRRTLPLSTRLSPRRSISFALLACLKFLNTSDLSTRKPLVMDALPASLSLRSGMSSAVHPQELRFMSAEENMFR